jgi:septum formation topological specificity factor MinE
MAQSRSYSCDKLTMRQAERDVLDLITKFLQSSNENQNYAA